MPIEVNKNSSIEVKSISFSKEKRRPVTFLSFANRNVYEKALIEMGEDSFDKWEAQFSGYVSARKSGGLEGVVDDKLATLLSPDGMIQIGKHIFKIDVLNETALVIEESAGENAKMALYNSEVNSNEVMLFSTGDDVLDLLDAGSKGRKKDGGIDGIFGIGCPENGTESESLDPLYYYTCPDFKQDCGYERRIRFELAYQKAGIYFSLVTSAKHQVLLSGLIWDGQMDNNFEGIAISAYVKYKPNCRDEKEHSQNWGWNIPYEFSGYTTDLYYQRYRPYSSSRSLYKYKLESRAVLKYKNADGSSNYFVGPLETIVARY